MWHVTSPVSSYGWPATRSLTRRMSKLFCTPPNTHISLSMGFLLGSGRQHLSMSLTQSRYYISGLVCHLWWRLGWIWCVHVIMIRSFLKNWGVTRSQAKTHAESQSLQVVGYYQATERLDDHALAPVGEKVASKIKENFDNAFALVVRIHDWHMLTRVLRSSYR